jgi:hypothetical protein
LSQVKVFNRHSAYLWVQTVHLFIPICSCIQGLPKINKNKLARHFCDFVDRRYLFEFEIKDTTDRARFVWYLDLHLEIDSEGRLRTKHYDKRDDFNFPIVNFPFICNNIPATPAYGVYISQLIRYSYQDFFDRGLQLTSKVLNQEFRLAKLKSSLRRFYGRHYDLINRYGIPVSQITTDMFHLS